MPTPLGVLLVFGLAFLGTVGPAKYIEHRENQEIADRRAEHDQWLQEQREAREAKRAAEAGRESDPAEAPAQDTPAPRTEAPTGPETTVPGGN